MKLSGCFRMASKIPDVAIEDFCSGDTSKIRFGMYTSATTANYYSATLSTMLREYRNMPASYTDDAIILLNLFTGLHDYQITPSLSTNK